TVSCLFLRLHPPPCRTPFPYATLFRSTAPGQGSRGGYGVGVEEGQGRAAYPALRAAAGDTLAVGFGLFPLGVAFGVLLVQSGFAWWWAPVFSIMIYAGSLEFLAVGLILAVTPLASIALTTFLVNFR